MMTETYFENRIEMDNTLLKTNNSDCTRYRLRYLFNNNNTFSAGDFSV